MIKHLTRCANFPKAEKSVALLKILIWDKTPVGQSLTQERRNLVEVLSTTLHIQF